MSESKHQKQNKDMRELMLLVTKTVLGVEGVSSMADTLTDTLKNLSRISGDTHGISMSEDEDGLSMDIFINVYYQTKIPDLAWDIQSAVKGVLETGAKRKVKKIDIHVQGVEMRKEGEA